MYNNNLIELTAVVTVSFIQNGSGSIVTAKFTPTPQELVIHINNFAAKVSSAVKEDLFEVVSIYGETNACVCVYLDCDGSIYGFSKEAHIVPSRSIKQKINDISFDLSQEIKLKITYEILCNHKFRNQKVLPPKNYKSRTSN